MRRGHLLQGTLDLLVLNTLRAGPRHGYDIARSIHRTSRGAFRILDGALYASLERLTARGWLQSSRGTTESGKAARFYDLTTEGRRMYRNEVTRWLQYVTAVTRVLK
jgi:transcriptional regulator